MSDESPEPFGKETARAGGEIAKFGVRALDSLDRLFGYGAEVLGTVPHDLVGVLGGEWLLEVRLRNRDKLRRNTRRILEERGAKEPFEGISPSIAVPLIEAAVDESREELAELWARLLAAAADPTRKGRIRLSFITTLKQMDPLDAKILEALYDHSPGGFARHNTNGRDVLSNELAVSHDEVLVSFGNLERLNCLGFGDRSKIDPLISPLGKLLIEALR
jgi:Abortive infection alpha